MLTLIFSYISKYASKAESNAPAFPSMLSDITNNMQASGKAQIACQKLLNKMLGERTYSAQETAHLLLSIPLVRTSFSFQSLNLSKDGALRAISTNNDEDNDPLDTDTRTLTGESWLQRYTSRAIALNDLSLYEVCCKYNWRGNEWRRRREKTTVILRTYPRLSPNPDHPDYEQYCRIKVLLHHPFRNLDDLTKREDGTEHSFAEVFADCQVHHHHPRDTLRNLAPEAQNDEDEDEEINVELAEMDEADWQVYTRLFPNTSLPAFTKDDIGHRPLDDGWDLLAAHQQWENVNRMAAYITEQKREIEEQHGLQDNEGNTLVDLSTLADEQKQVFDRFVDAYKATLDGTVLPSLRLNIDGTAGCGKTYLIRAICQELRRLAHEAGKDNPIRVLAPSGVAAWNISGQTIHSALGLPANNMGSLPPLSGSRLSSLQQQWKGTHFVIIDEKSMLGQRLLAKIDSRLRQLRPLDQPFGGYHMALIGDFAQLPPVGDRALYVLPPPQTDTSDNAQLSRNGFTLYRSFTASFCLKVIHRQQGDSPQQQLFRTLLLNARNGGLTVEDWQVLQSRQDTNVPQQERDSFSETTYLFTKAEAVEDANFRQLVHLNAPCARIKAKHDGGSEAARATAEDAAGLEAEVVLARGAKVMIIRNVWQYTGTLFHFS